MARKQTDLSIIKKAHIEESPNLAKTTDGVPDHNIDGFPLLLDQLDFFEHNPRESENPKYEEIKESIRETGLQQSLVVTKRRDDDKFTLFYGGNTRLKILKELYKETRDRKFFNLKVNYRPFTSTSNVIANHMSENENHGGMLFIDKAKGATDFKRFYEKENDVTLSARKLAETLKDSGWSVSLSIVALYIYAIDNLAKVIPNCLNAGMGKPKIGELRKYVTAIKTYADFIGEDLLSEQAALDEWYEELSESDEPDLFNAEAVFSRFAYRLTHIVKKSHTEVEAQLGHILSEGVPWNGGSKYIEVPPPVEQPDTSQIGAGSASTVATSTIDNSNSTEGANETNNANKVPVTTSADIGSNAHPAETPPRPQTLPPSQLHTSTQNQGFMPLGELTNRIHALISQNPCLGRTGVVTATNRPPFFFVDETVFNECLETLEKLIENFRDNSPRVDAETYILYRFIKLWLVYKIYLTQELTHETARGLGLSDLMKGFDTYGVIQGFLDRFPTSASKSKIQIVSGLTESGIVDINREMNLIESAMEPFFG